MEETQVECGDCGTEMPANPDDCICSECRRRYVEAEKNCGPEPHDERREREMMMEQWD